MPIFPLPQYEADIEADRRDRETYERLKPPSSIVVRYGVMKLVGEFPYSGDAKPGCGSKIVIRTHRGVELGEMLTSTCPNSGCSKSVSRQEMLEYIENSGGRDYPFSTDGRVMRIATSQDIAEQSRLDGMKVAMVRVAREMVARLSLPMKVVDAEPILGGERLTFYFTRSASTSANSCRSSRATSEPASISARSAPVTRRGSSPTTSAAASIVAASSF
jgi:hypothetical protein